MDLQMKIMSREQLGSRIAFNVAIAVERIGPESAGFRTGKLLDQVDRRTGGQGYFRMG